MIEELFITKSERKFRREDIEIGETDGHYYYTQEGEYVVDGIIYKKNYVEYIGPQTYFYCVTCNDWFKESEFLRTAIPNLHTLWIANMITHHRHVHLKHWDKTWSNVNDRYRMAPKGDYETEKRKVNEQAKRVLLRKHADFLIKYGFKTEHFLGLEYNDEKTLTLLDKKLRTET